MLMMVTLGGGGVHVSASQRLGSDKTRDLQSSCAEHDGNRNLLPQVKLQTLQLRQRDGQHPHVLGNRRGGVGPTDGVCVKAGAYVFAVPYRRKKDINIGYYSINLIFCLTVCPVEADGVAVEDGEEGEDDGPEDGVCDRRPQHGPDSLLGEDFEVKKEEGQL